MKTKLFLYFGAVVLGVALMASPAAAQVQWHPTQTYDDGQQPAIAVHPSGLVLSFHRTQNQPSNTLWYHVGRVNGTSITWGPSHGAPAKGSWPNVAITKDGYVLFMWSSGDTKASSTLYYAVGKVDLHGDESQTIDWIRTGKPFDAGFHSSMVMNEDGVIVEVHESGTGGSGLYYRVGRFGNRALDDFTIVWDSGDYGRHYDDGVNPHIAINNHNQVVEVHQVPGENLLHYRRGVLLSNGRIDFRPSQRYDSDGKYPVVALLDNGQVFEAHVEGDLKQVTSSPGTLSLTNPDLIDWSYRILVARISGRQGALATDGTQLGPRIAVGSWPTPGGKWGATIKLHSVVGTIDGR